MSLNSNEQYLLELINRARLDPAAEAERQGLDLNAGLKAGTIGTDARQALAPNAMLEDAAEGHSVWMLENDSFSHGGQNGSNGGDRMRAEGYDFTGHWSWRENLAWRGVTGTSIDVGAAILAHHEGLFGSETHRVNTFAPQLREIGIAQVTGQFTHDGIDYAASMMTQNFAVAGTDGFVTGVAYDDRDGNRFYSIGEGVKGVAIHSGAASASTTAAGGYALAVTPGSATDVTVMVDDAVLAELAIDTSHGNVKLDVVTDGDGDTVLLLSGSATVMSGLSEVRLLGVADLDLTGSETGDFLIGNSGQNQLTGGEGRDRLSGEDGDDILTGGVGRDRLSGGVGDDTLYGGGGMDVLYGGKGHDTLYGGAHDDRLVGNNGNDLLFGGDGDDFLMGGAGADTFGFSAGLDRIADFEVGIDRLLIAAGLADDVQDVIDRARVVDGDTIIDFDQGNMLIVEGLTDVTVLADNLEFM
ncbi:CAP domain-containing protein [Loktanella sp. SALINAS62]|uniref:CAP domain-containing protein n=1 Tax=Loktanella sp. SALINAS62 TaxID=2706124 RepID=UPI001B8B6B96|nr:hypothetical protein [Loktanella sp. SALINAS62]